MSFIYTYAVNKLTYGDTKALQIIHTHTLIILTFLRQLSLSLVILKSIRHGEKEYAAEKEIMHNATINSSLFLSLINGGICIFGDYLVDINHESLIAKAFFDNVTHAAIGLFSAMVLILESNHRIMRTEQFFLIGMNVAVSSLIDIDHFIVAKSLKLSVKIYLKISTMKSIC